MGFTPSAPSGDLLERVRGFDDHVVRPEEATYRPQRRDSGHIRFEPDGAHYVVNAHKWFTSGALAPRCKVAVLMGVTTPAAAPYHRQSMILVPLDTPGVTLVRGLPVFGHDEGPGHAETLFENVRLPKDNLLGEEGGGFAIAQARLGPGRI